MATSFGDFGDMSDEEETNNNVGALPSKKTKKKKKKKKKKTAPAVEGILTNAIITALAAEGFSAAEIQETQDLMWVVRYTHVALG